VAPPPLTSASIVHDGGAGFADPLAAYFAPDGHATHGHGLWLRRQACDCLEAATHGTGTPCGC
jgi:hypothetical protein